jgi:hypothetical protein
MTLEELKEVYFEYFKADLTLMDKDNKLSPDEIEEHSRQITEEFLEDELAEDIMQEFLAITPAEVRKILNSHIQQKYLQG